MNEGDEIIFEITNKRAIAEDVVLFTLETKGEIGKWIPGQYITLQIPSENTYAPRSFSVASHPIKSPIVEIIVKINKDGGVATEYFRTANKGYVLHGSRPKGNLVLSNTLHPAILIGAGAGVAPLLPMISHILKVEKLPRSITLLFYRIPGNYLEIEHYLSLLHEEQQNFNFFIIENELPCTAFIEKDNVIPIMEFYLCGGKQFVLDMETQLIASGFNSRYIHYEWKVRQ